MYNKFIREMEQGEAKALLYRVEGLDWRPVQNGKVAHLWMDHVLPLCISYRSIRGSYAKLPHCQACKDKLALLEIVAGEGDDA